MSPRFSQPLRFFLPVLAIGILASTGVLVLGPPLLETLLQRRIEALTRERGISSVRLGPVRLEGFRNVRLEFLSLVLNPILEVEARDLVLTLRPFGVLRGRKGIDSIAVQEILFRLGDGSSSPGQWIGILESQWSARAGPARRGNRPVRWPDVHLGSVMGTIRMPHEEWVLRGQDVRLEAVREVWSGGMRRFLGDLELHRSKSAPLQMRIRGFLGPNGFEEVSTTWVPAWEVVLRSGAIRLGGIRWMPEGLTLLDLDWQGPSGERIAIPRVLIRFEATPDSRSVALPWLHEEWRAMLEHLYPEKGIASMEFDRPSFEWVPHRPLLSSPISLVGSPGPEDRAVRLAWLSRGNRRIWQAIQGLRAHIDRLRTSLPRVPWTVLGASLLPLENGPRPHGSEYSLTRVGSNLRWDPDGGMTFEVHLDAPETPQGTFTWTIGSDGRRWSVMADLRDLPLEPWRFLWGGQGGPTRLRTARFRLEVDPEDRRLQASGEIAIEDWSVSVPAVASVPLSLREIALSGRLELGSDDLTLRDAEFRCGRMVVPLSLRISRIESAPRIEIQGRIDRLSAADLQESLPPELLGSLRGMRLAGTFAGRFEADIDTARLDNVRLDLEPDVSDLRVLSLGDTVDLDLLRSVFLHQIEETDGTVVRRLVGEGTPFWVSLSEMPPWLVPALTIAEDATFFRHRGFSLSAIRRSLRVNLERGGFVQGASTLSQQLAKNLFLSREKTLARKIQEALLTWQLEKTLTKERIVELYLNIIEWGPEVFGLREAAGHYFAKRPEELTPMETAFLIVMIPGPRLFHEQLLAQGRPPALYRSRAEALIRELGRQGVLTPEQVEASLAEHPRFAPVEVAVPPPPSDEGLGYEPSPMPRPPEPP